MLLWDVANGRALHVLLGHAADVADLGFSPDAGLLATCSADCSLRVWDTRTGAPPTPFQPCTAPDVSIDNFWR